MTTNTSAMHNDIMASGSKERPPMLALGIYAQWQLHFLRYVNLKPNRKLIRQCIFEVTYKLTQITIIAIPVDGENPVQASRVKDLFRRFIHELNPNDIGEAPAFKMMQSMSMSVQSTRRFKDVHVWKVPVS
ncbi:hypothetical protein Tco_0861742 [Tanacetum coccineum]|uniref:Uncharacterized protein n=1 Tax=Tanacetum coccineum TaxID=301880 RepID=A0ABQ5BIP9_9ASTR